MKAAKVLSSVWSLVLSSAKSRVFLGLVVGLSSLAKAGDQLPICFIVGAGGGSDSTLKRFIPEMKSRGIEWIPFTPGEFGTVQERGVIVGSMIQKKLDKDPGFQCHAFAYSMGGPVIRYIYHHVPLRVRGKSVPASSVIKSMTSFSSPHRGTPLAGWLRRYAPKYSRGVEDLSEKEMLKYNSPEYPETFSPMPRDIPAFSYLTFIESEDEAQSFIVKAGFQLIKKIYGPKGWDTRSDGIVPLTSQPFGEPLAVVRAEHAYFDSDLGLRPWAPDIYELHWNFLEGNLARNRPLPNSLDETIGTLMESDLVRFTDAPAKALLNGIDL